MIFERKADDDDVDMSLAPRFAAPGKGAVGEDDFEIIAVEKQRPQLGNLLTLGD